MITKIILEDKGQDLLWLCVDQQCKIIDAGPFQSRIWKGGFVPLFMVKIGKRCPIHHPPGIRFGSLKYKVKSIENIEE